MEVAMTRAKGRSKTKYPGVQKVGKNKYLIDGEAKDPRTGRLRQIERTLSGVTARQAASIRADKLDKIRNGQLHTKEEKQRLSDFCEQWLRLKTPSLDWKTAGTYALALAHVCGEPGYQIAHEKGGLGDFYQDKFDRSDVQQFANAKLALGYSSTTVRGWLRVFKTMAKDYGWSDPTFRISLPDAPDRGSNMLNEEQLLAFLGAMKTLFPQHYALTVVLAFTGLRFCHATALKFEDIDEVNGLLHIKRKQVRGRVGTVSRKKKAPKEIPIEKAVLDVLRWHRQSMIVAQHPGLTEGWVFPSKVGKLFLGTNSLSKAWKASLKAAGIADRFTVHGLRKTFNDLTRRAKVDPLVIKSITGHVTEDMREHYSTIDLSEKRRAVAAVVERLRFSSETVDRTVDEGGGA
jgi:integrase